MVRLRGVGLLCATALAVGAGLGGLQGCGPGLNIDYGYCHYVCPVDGISQGNTSISGLSSVDAFFSSVFAVRDASTALRSSVRAEIDGIAASLELDTGAMTLEEAGSAVEAGLDAKIEANLQAGLPIRFQPPRCEASTDLAARAAAECDYEVEPGTVSIACEGSCEIDASAAGECTSGATLSCVGTAPELDCRGICSGTCQLEAATACEGSCNGECTGGCSACVGGICDVQGGITVNCVGSCDALCTGSCELNAAGSCEGSREGSCEYSPTSGACEPDASVKCQADASGAVDCEGICEGSLESPNVSAECQAAVDAKSKAEVQCVPPVLDTSFVFAANLSAQEQAEFRAWLSGFKPRFASLVAARAKLEFVGEASAEAANSGVAAIEGVIDSVLGRGASLSAIIGLGCASDELPVVRSILSEVSGDVSASLQAILYVGSTVAGEDWEDPLRYDVYAPTPSR